MPACGACGSQYRPPSWGREYLCPACGRPLAGPPPRARGAAPWLLGGAAAILAASLVVRLAADRLRSRPAARAPASQPAPPVEPPSEARARQRHALMEADLKQEPVNPTLLNRLAWNALALSVLTRDRPPERSRWLERARGYVERLRRAAPMTDYDLEMAMRQPDQLAWVNPPPLPRSPGRRARGRLLPASAAPRLPLVPANLPAAPPSPPGEAAGAPPPQAVAGNAPNGPRGAPGGGPAESENGSGPAANGPPEALNGPGAPNAPAMELGSRLLAPGFMPGNMTTGDSRGALSPGTFGAGGSAAEQDRRVAELRRRYQRARGDVRAGDVLGVALENRAETARLAAGADARRGEREYRVWMREAARLYLELAGTARLRLHRGTFYVAAAGVHARLGEWEAQHRLLRQAATEIPYSALVWHELQGACLRLGRYEESRDAARKLREWRFPDLRFAVR